VATLLKAGSSDDSVQRQTAAESLANLPGEDIDQELMNRAAEASGLDLENILVSLGTRSAVQATPLMLRAASDDSREVRRAAHRVLREIAPTSMVPQMVQELIDAPAGERSAWVTTLAAVINRMPADTSRTTALQSALVNADSPEVRAALLTVLGGTGVDAALAPLRAALDHADPDVRLASLRQLSNWPTPEPLADLQSFAGRANSPQERTLALRGFVRLIGLATQAEPAAMLELYRRAMSLAGGPDDQRAVLSGLASVPTVAALQYAQGFLGTDALRAEAELAVVNIGRLLAGESPSDAREAISPIAQSGSNPTARTAASELLQQLDRLRGFLTAWQVSPAYSREGLSCAELFDVPFPPEELTSPQAIVWQPVPAGLNPEQPWLIDLLAVHGGEQKVAYLRTVVLSDQAQEATLELGSDDGNKVWLNGDLVHANNTQRAAEPGQDKVRIQLKAVANDLMVKVTQNISGWALCAKLLNPDGTPTTGIRTQRRGS
jgi:hypothetical protein